MHIQLILRELRTKIQRKKIARLASSHIKVLRHEILTRTVKVTSSKEAWNLFVMYYEGGDRIKKLQFLWRYNEKMHMGK